MGVLLGGLGAGHCIDGGAEFPEEMTWIWRGYDPAKTAETYEMDPAEKSKPYFRVASLNRDSEE